MINCIVIDDEALAIDLLEDYIKRVPFLSLVGKFTRATDSMELIRHGNVDLIFLDIQMPDITGIQFLKTLGSEPMIIFSTAYSNYALDGFNLKVLDYLLKPFHFDRFLQAASKAHELHILKNKKQIDLKDNDYIFVNSEHNLIRVNFNTILYIEGLKDYIKIFTANNIKPIITRLSLKALEEKLPTSEFFRIHKSFIVSIKKIDFVRNNTIRIGDKTIPIGETQKEKFYSLIEGSN
jgi:DNA-binding LytR/AlgR family response regulator